MKRVWLLSCLAFLAGGCATPRPHSLTPGDILAMTRAGLTDDEIIHRIADSRAPSLSEADATQLRQGGVSARVVDAWRDAAVRFRASEKRRADVEDEEWHQRYGLWYRHP